MSITSEEVNYLIFRYLQEAGFSHSTYTFQHESHLHKSQFKDVNVQPGHLISVLQKGLQYMSVEAHVQEDGSEMLCNSPFSLIYPHKCDPNPNPENPITSTSQSSRKHKRDGEPVGSNTLNKRERKEEKRIQKEKERRLKREAAGDSLKDKEKDDSEHVANGIGEKEERKEDVMDMDEKESSAAPASVVPAEVEVKINGDSIPSSVPATSHPPQPPAPLEPVQQPQVQIISPEDVIVLQGHTSEVFSCAWNPSMSSLLASGSGDATARLWQVPPSKDDEIPPPIVLNHLPNLNDNKDVTTLDWNPSGNLLATGSYDGQARIWNPRGDLRFVMTQHRGPIFSLKWNKKGDLLLSGSADNTTVVWDPENGEMKQQFELHTAAILDVDWVDRDIFASASTDKTICVCKVDETGPLKIWQGHGDEVNAIRWDPTGNYLASCSDDMTAKIWTMSSDTYIQDLRGHEMQIYTIQWAPVDRSQEHPTRILGTASFDATVRLWDAVRGDCLQVLRGHTEPVYSIEFSPDARWLATGSFDEVLNVYEARNGERVLAKTFRGSGGIFEVHFSKNGERLAACTSTMKLVILDLRS